MCVKLTDKTISVCLVRYYLRHTQQSNLGCADTKMQPNWGVGHLKALLCRTVPSLLSAMLSLPMLSTCALDPADEP